MNKENEQIDEVEILRKKLRLPVAAFAWIFMIIGFAGYTELLGSSILLFLFDILVLGEWRFFK